MEPRVEVGFYHCTRAAPLAVLPRLVQKAAEAGFRVLIQSDDPAVRDAVDGALWTFEADSFLPHGLAGGEHDAEQPVLIAEGFDPANGARIALAIGGGLPPADAGFERILYLFDGNDNDALSRARRHWKALSARDGVTPVYWQQAERGWQKRG
ncbi:DNA polymerase III chi subunit [Pacificimonas flava]|uniref:DNA polymerase III chi subunit n=1 Tax=Pacificimonas flava TaxID=1234595 RepID=M2U8R4_9SPHN|nr:DNA polymerase III chi subunit [Pacificimonas flava]